MDIGSILLILALFFLTVLFIGKPFLDAQRQVAAPAVTGEEHLRSGLLAQHESILLALQELETDYALQKVPEDEYQQQRTDLLLAGAEILKQLDRLKGADQPAPVRETRSKGGKEDRQKDDLEALIAARRQERQKGKRRSCPNCGKTVQAGDAFCPSCGKKLAGGAS